MSLEKSLADLTAAVTENNALLSQVLSAGSGKPVVAATRTATATPATTPATRGRPRTVAPANDIEAVVAKAQEAVGVIGKEEVVRVLKSFGAPSSRALKPDQYDAFVSAIDAMLEPEPTGGEDTGEV